VEQQAEGIEEDAVAGPVLLYGACSLDAILATTRRFGFALPLVVGGIFGFGGGGARSGSCHRAIFLARCRTTPRAVLF